MSVNQAYALLWLSWGVTVLFTTLYFIKKDSGTKASFLALTIGALFVTNMAGKEWKKAELHTDIYVAAAVGSKCRDYTKKTYNDYMKNYHNKLYMPYFMGPSPLPWGDRITKC